MPGFSCFCDGIGAFGSFWTVAMGCVPPRGDGTDGETCNSGARGASRLAEGAALADADVTGDRRIAEPLVPGAVVGDVHALGLRLLLKGPLKIVEEFAVHELGEVSQVPVQDAVDELLF